MYVTHRKEGRPLFAATPTASRRWTVCRPHDLVPVVIWIFDSPASSPHDLWIGVTAHPNAEWIARQLTEAYAWAQAPQYIIRDRDRVYGDLLIRRLRAMGIRVRPIAPRSPWQNGHSERLIGSIRRECTFASCWDRTKGITMTRARTYR
jgi:Integrase core domain